VFSSYSFQGGCSRLFVLSFVRSLNQAVYQYFIIQSKTTQAALFFGQMAFGLKIKINFY